MSLTEQWDEDLHRAEAVLEEDNRRFGVLHIVSDAQAPDADDPAPSEPEA
jgi:hypothetical protein